MFSRKTKYRLDKIRGWVIFISCLVLVLVVLPYSWWKSKQDYQNIVKHGIYLKGNLVMKKGFLFPVKASQYSYRGVTYTLVQNMPSDVRLKLGDRVKVWMDTLNPENAMVIWPTSGGNE